MKRFQIYLAMMAIMTMGYGSLSAQEKNNSDKRQLSTEQRIEKRVQHIQKELKLDDQKAAQFAPLYKDYLQTLLSLRKEKPAKRDKNMSEEQTDQLILDKFDHQKKAIDIRKDYYLKFRKVLSPVQARKALSIYNNHQDKNKNQKVKDIKQRKHKS